MSTNKKYIFFVSYYLLLFIYFTYQLFITRLFVIFPLLFLGAFLFSSNKKLATSVVNFLLSLNLKERIKWIIISFIVTALLIIIGYVNRVNEAIIVHTEPLFGSHLCFKSLCKNI